jgi:hypothetical protein
MDEFCDERKADDDPVGYRFRVSFSMEVFVDCVLDFFNGGDDIGVDNDAAVDEELSLDKRC